MRKINKLLKEAEELTAAKDAALQEVRSPAHSVSRHILDITQKKYRKSKVI